jgi:hypothetical protein
MSDQAPKPTAQDLRDLLEAILDPAAPLVDRRGAATLLRAELASLDGLRGRLPGADTDPPDDSDHLGTV